MVKKADEPCPEWPFEVDFDLAKWLLDYHIVKITHHWSMTGVDTSKDWIELHADGKSKRQVNTSFFSNQREFGFEPDHASLIQLKSYIHPDMHERIEEIRKWNKRNARERSEYKRLRAKFETAKGITDEQ